MSVSQEVAQKAFTHFTYGLATGEWEEFLDMLTDDFTFWFPKEPFQGLNVGKDKAIAFFQFVSQTFDRNLLLIPENITSSETTVVFEIRIEGERLKLPPDERAIISFDIRDNKLCAFRQYLLFFHPSAP